MKKSIHPQLLDTTIIYPDGSNIKIKTTLGGEYRHDIVHSQHQAWAKEKRRSSSIGKSKKKEEWSKYDVDLTP